MPEISTRYGQLAVPDPSRDLIGRFLLHYGEWAQEEVRFVAAALDNDRPRVCDIGAFVGTFGLGLAQARPLGALVFVEANPELLPLLTRNARLAPGIEAVVVGAAVGPEGATAEASYDPANLGSLSFAQPPGGARVKAPPSPRRLTLAELRRDFGPFDLVKIDAEGLERDILLGDPEGLRDADCSYWLECNEGPESLVLCNLLLSAGFRVQYFAFPSHSPTNILANPVPLLPLAFEAGLWATRGRPATLAPELRDEGCMLSTIGSIDELRAAMWRTPRFGRAEWSGQPAPVVAALAGRELRGESFERFPDEPPPPLVPVAELRARIAELEAALKPSAGAAEQLAAASARLGELEAALTTARQAAAQASQMAEQQATERAQAATALAAMEAHRTELGQEVERLGALVAELKDRAARAQNAAEVLVADAQERALTSEDRCRAAEAELVILRARLAPAEARAAEAARRAAAAEALADERTMEADRRVAAAEALADERRREADRRVADAEGRAAAAIAEAVSRARSAEAMAEAIAGSTTWRLTGPIRTRLSGRPRLTRATKVALTPFWRAARLLFGRRRR